MICLVQLRATSTEFSKAQNRPSFRWTADQVRTCRWNLTTAKSLLLEHNVVLAHVGRLYPSAPFTVEMSMRPKSVCLGQARLARGAGGAWAAGSSAKLAVPRGHRCPLPE